MDVVEFISKTTRSGPAFSTILCRMSDGSTKEYTVNELHAAGYGDELNEFHAARRRSV